MSLQFVHSHDAEQRHSAAIWALAATSTDHVLSASLDGTLALHASSTQSSFSSNPIPGLNPGARIRTWPAHPLAWVSLSVASGNGIDDKVKKRVLVNSLAGTTVLYDFTTGETLGKRDIGSKESGPGTKDGFAEPAWSVSLSSDGKTYVSTGGSASLTIHSASPSASSDMMDADEQSFGARLGDIPTGRSRFGLFVKHSPVEDNKVALSTEGGQVFVFDTEKRAVVNSWASHAMPVRSLGWGGDGSVIMSASDDRRLVLHDTRASSSSSAVAHLTGHTLSVLSVALSPGDGRLALSGSRDGTVRIWDVGMRKAVGVVREGRDVWGVAWRTVSSSDVDVKDGLSSGAVGGYGGIGGSGVMGFVTGGDEGLVRWYRGAGMV